MERKMLVVGIIGPYFGGGNRLCIDTNIAKARYVMRAIVNHFKESRLVGPWCPHSHTAQFEIIAEAPEPYYHALDDAIYEDACKGFVLLPDWEKSSGARRDRDNAISAEKPIFELKSYSDEDIAKLLSELEEWAKELGRSSR